MSIAPATHPDVSALRSLNLREVRARIDSGCERRAAWPTFGALALDLAIYITCIAVALLADPVWLKIIAGLGAGCGTAFLFIWAHDAAHGALFNNRRIAETLGTIAMLPSLNIYRLWSFGHNRIHHGFTSLAGFDWIWRPWTPAEYATKPAWERALYRAERTLPGCALHYLRHVWWAGMLRFNPGRSPRERRRIRHGKLVLAFALALGGLAYLVGGVASVICAVLLPFIVFNYFIALFTYLHHTHPDIPFFLEREQWSPALAQLYCSTVVRFSRPMELLTHNIMIHVPHHVNPHIPFYRLPRAYADLNWHYGDYIHEYRFSWRVVLRIFRQCKLFDYERGHWRPLPAN